MKLKELGILLLSISIPVMVFSIFVINYMELFYVFLGIFIIGLASFSISDNYIFPYVIREMIESSALNIEAILEEFDARGKGIYLNKEGRDIAFIPYEENEYFEKDHVNKIISSPLRILNERGVTVFIPTPPINKEGDERDESFLKKILIEHLDLADDVKLIKNDVENKSELIINIINPKGRYLNIPRYEKCLGHLESSIALSSLSKYYGKPIHFVREAKNQNGIILEGEILNG
ncbi:hypothetical protein Calag_0932 [Caldisphaera lagunensis DSM 15908]|uniref:Uncharacterized protein n=1 Tax=Caldisphaera lagunensis (strain DSM 15908 / JCM 11604 / ANMR 0165 / IC-154) TaxID=1056495 RepID=L0A9U2_CALLD|nr:hypothetical protein [Caldisphaera lagunensis]AFZ70663.1 hypothetical protein Calag_0932 [Caldisphaera lagunensis DSM 15908]